MGLSFPICKVGELGHGVSKAILQHWQSSFYNTICHSDRWRKLSMAFYVPPYSVKGQCALTTWQELSAQLQPLFSQPLSAFPSILISLLQSPLFHFHVFFSFSVPFLAFSGPASYPLVAQSKGAPHLPSSLSPTCARSPLPMGLLALSQQLQSRKVKLIAAPFPSAALVCST